MIRTASRSLLAFGVIDNHSTDGKFNQRALAVLARSYVELKLLDKEPDMSKLYTEAFLPKR